MFKQLYEEALGNLNSPADWETRAICEIMNTGIAGGIIQGWVAYKARSGIKYGSQKAGSVSTKLRRRGRFSGNHGRRSPANGTSILKKPPVDSLVDALVDSRLTGKSLIFGAFLSFVNHVNQEIKRSAYGLFSKSFLPVDTVWLTRRQSAAVHLSDIPLSGIFHLWR